MSEARVLAEKMEREMNRMRRERDGANVEEAMVDGVGTVWRGGEVEVYIKIEFLLCC